MDRAVSGLRPAVLAVLLALAVAAIYRGVLPLPYARDDWALLHMLSFGSSIEYVTASLSTENLLFRPLANLWVLLEFRLFGLSARGAHVLGLLLHLANALLVASVVRSLPASRGAAWATAFLYATAVTVHEDPLLWAVGIYEIGGALGFLGALALFLRGRRGAGLAAFGAALLCKETTVVLPAALFAREWLAAERPGARSLRTALARTAPYWFLAGAYLLIVKGSAPSPFGLSPDDPYHMSFSPGLLLDNALTYLGWSVHAVLPIGVPASDAGWRAMSAAALAVLLAACVFAPAAERGTRGFLAVWYALALAPALPLSHHAYRYYLVLALPAFLALGVLLARDLLRAAVAPRRIRAAIGIVGVAVSALVSGVFFERRLERAAPAVALGGSNELARSSATVALVWSELTRLHPELPTGANLVFAGVMVHDFLGAKGPQVWYADESLRVFRAGRVRGDRESAWVERPEGRLPLDPARTFYFRRSGSRLVETSGP